MVALPETRTVEEAELKSFNNFCVPNGSYQAVIVKSEWVDPFQSGDPQDLLLTGVITQGEYANTEFELRCGLLNEKPIKSDNPSFTWQKAGYGTLAGIAKALGMIHTPKDSSDFHNKPFFMRTEIKKGGEYTDKNGATRTGADKSVIKGYSPIPAGGVATPPPVEAVQAVETAPTESTAGAPTANPFAG